MKFIFAQLFWIGLIILAFMTSKTSIGISPNSLLGVFIKISTILAVILFGLTLLLLNEKQAKILEDRGEIMEVFIIAYALLVIWAIFEIRYKLIGFVPNGVWYN